LETVSGKSLKYAHNLVELFFDPDKSKVGQREPNQLTYSGGDDPEPYDVGLAFQSLDRELNLFGLDWLFFGNWSQRRFPLGRESRLRRSQYVVSGAELLEDVLLRNWFIEGCDSNKEPATVLLLQRIFLRGKNAHTHRGAFEFWLTHV